MCAGFLVWATRPRPVCGPHTRFCRQCASKSAGTPSEESARNAPSVYSNRMPNLASQMRIALASMAWNTGSSSPRELEITLSTSDVAVCCPSASASSRVSSSTSRSRPAQRSLSRVLPLERSARASASSPVVIAGAPKHLRPGDGCDGRLRSAWPNAGGRVRFANGKSRWQATAKPTPVGLDRCQVG